MVVTPDLLVSCLKKLSRHQVLFGDGHTVSEYESITNVLETVDFFLSVQLFELSFTKNKQ